MSNEYKCDICNDTGAVCEDHPDLPWESGDGITCCEAPGILCVCGQSPFQEVFASINPNEVTRHIQ